MIGLYPNLLPQDFRNQLEYPDRLPELEGGELEKGLLALIEFLTEVRRRINIQCSLQLTRGIAKISLTVQ